MNKIYIKLIAITLTLVLSASVVAMSSYAWLVLSGNPVATGIQVTIGGGNTILIAPDMRQEVEGTVYHYPGPFSDTMNFAQFPAYDYLKQVAGLTPVSTADGVNWYLPEYYDFSDEEVRQGKVLSGELKDVSDFLWDGELKYANLTQDQLDLAEKGSYYYLDFWVVSPGENFTLRISTGQDSGGSFVIDLLNPVQTENGYTLAYPDHQGSPALRVGFLANPTQLIDDTMLHYQSSTFFNDLYTSLRGLYVEPNSGTPNLDSDRFVIYEPNANLHPYGGAEQGSYVETKPVGIFNGEVKAISVYDRLTIQTASTWANAASGMGSEIEQRFQAAMYGKNLADMTPEQLATAFYDEYLQRQISPYVMKGDFIRKTSSLSQYGSVLSAQDFLRFMENNAAGATEDVYIIELERNVPQRIRMFIWLEGQDVDCVNAVTTAGFGINIELAGSNPELN